MTKPAEPRSNIAALFFEDTKHLGPEGQRRVLDVLHRANQAAKKREAAAKVVPLRRKTP